MTSCLALPHPFVAHKVVLRSLDESLALGEGNTGEGGGVGEEGMYALELFIACGKGLGMGGGSGVGDGVGNVVGIGVGDSGVGDVVGDVVGISIVVGSGVGIAECGRWRIRMLTAAVVAVAFTAGNDKGVGRCRKLCELLCNDSAPSSWFSTLTPPTFSFAPNVTPDNFKSPGLAPPPCPPSCPVTCMPHVTCLENPKA
jgi:hypothetical protein